ncbi:CASH domain-dontaining protein [Candidatus Methanophagaceae archaeon]|nr:CASH domain-dontaining protein [Methanophagales archaeon]
MEKERRINIWKLGILLIVAMCAVSIAPAATAQETPFVIYGYVFNADGTECDNSNVNITNMDTGSSKAAENTSGSNCYLLVLTNGTDLNAGDVLKFDVTSPDGSQSKIVEHTVTLAEAFDGGLFDYDITLECGNTQTWHVDDDGSEYPNPDFYTIGDAINVALDGDTIMVYAGNYTNITVDKMLTLQGVDQPVIDAENVKSVAAVKITAQDVTLKGFKITNTGTGGFGVHVEKVANVVIEDNLIDGCNEGVWFDFCHGGTLRKNNISNCWGWVGLYDVGGGNVIYLNDFINNSGNVFCTQVNIWNTTEEITYSYHGNTFTNYMGNYWDDYTGEDANGDGIGDSTYDGKDNYPLIEPFENYFQSAQAQTWYLTSETKPTGAPTANDSLTHVRNNLMHKGSRTGTDTHFDLNSTEVAWFYADAGAENNLGFGEQSWEAYIRTEEIDGAEVGHNLTAEICKLANVTGDVTVIASHTQQLTEVGTKHLWSITCEDNAATTQDFSTGDWLAVRLSWDCETDALRIHYKAAAGSDSYIESPSSDPGYPIPELPTVILFGVGLLVITGYVALGRRKT